ncbi:MAG: hypothetical protein WA459_23140 [Stellaceae bacterium]
MREGFDQTLATLRLGLVAALTSDIDLRIEYDGAFATHTQDSGGQAKMTLRF